MMGPSNSENPASAFDDTLEDILELLEEDTQHFIYLTGAAGTGKTTLIERVKDECLLKKMVVATTIFFNKHSSLTRSINVVLPVPAAPVR